MLHNIAMFHFGLCYSYEMKAVKMAPSYWIAIIIPKVPSLTVVIISCFISRCPRWHLNERYQNPVSQIAQFFTGDQTSVVPKGNKVQLRPKSESSLFAYMVTVLSALSSQWWVTGWGEMNWHFSVDELKDTFLLSFSLGDGTKILGVDSILVWFGVSNKERGRRWT